MPSDTLLTPIEAKSIPVDAPTRCKFRIRFCKSEDLRFVSHHDLMHVCERMFRRAELPIPVTQGFNPRPRMWFALSLALGVVGRNELLEIEVAGTISAEELQQRLSRHCPPGFTIVRLCSIDAKLSARVRRAFYRFVMPQPIDDLQARCDRFLSDDKCWVDRARPTPRRIDIRPFVHELHASAGFIEMALWVTSNGAVRPEEVIAALGLKAMLDSGGVIERTDLEVYDELPAGAEPPPVERFAVEEITTNDAAPRTVSPPPTLRPTAIFDSPMSFDS